MNFERLAQNLPKWMKAEHNERGTFSFTSSNRIHIINSGNLAWEALAAFELFNQMQKVCGERGWFMDSHTTGYGTSFELWDNVGDDGVKMAHPFAVPDIVAAIFELATVFPWGKEKA